MAPAARAQPLPNRLPLSGAHRQPRPASMPQPASLVGLEEPGVQNEQGAQVVCALCRSQQRRVVVQAKALEGNRCGGVQWKQMSE